MVCVPSKKKDISPTFQKRKITTLTLSSGARCPLPPMPKFTKIQPSRPSPNDHRVAGPPESRAMLRRNPEQQLGVLTQNPTIILHDGLISKFCDHQYQQAHTKEKDHLDRHLVTSLYYSLLTETSVQIDGCTDCPPR